MKYLCFECGNDCAVRAHHVVPRELGGTKKIPLCWICSGKVRDHYTRLLSVAEQNSTKKLTTDQFALQMWPLIEPMFCGYKSTAWYLNAAGVKSRSGGIWHASTVSSVERKYFRLTGGAWLPSIYSLEEEK
tara:strand:- start:2884 stop:3276 length:393 start_codon:yes stop_codon:yes gene_type:complete